MQRYGTILCVMLLTACATENSNALRLKDTGKPIMHAVQSGRLHKLMNQLNDLYFERMLTEVELDRERRQRTGEMASIAADMIETLKEIPDMMSELSLDAHDRQVFLDLSGQLQENVSLLKQEAEQNYVDAIPDRLNRIVATCNACHSSFRQLPPK